jgi:hypothetical protein
VYYAYRKGLGSSWSAPIRVNSDGGCATFPWISARGDGHVALAWYQTSYGREIPAVNSSTPYQDQVPRTAKWYLHAAAILGADQPDPEIVQTRVDTHGRLLAGPLERRLWDFCQLAIGPDGHLNIAFSKLVGEAPKAFFVRSTQDPFA